MAGGLVLKVRDIRAFGLPDADKRPGGGSSDAYVKFRVLQADGTEFSAAQTGTVQDKRNPQWPGVVLELPLPGDFSDCKIRVEFWDDDPGANDFMGHAQLSIDEAGCILDKFVVDGYKSLYDFRASLAFDAPMAAAGTTTSDEEDIIGEPSVPPLPASVVAPPAVALPAAAPAALELGQQEAPPPPPPPPSKPVPAEAEGGVDKNETYDEMGEDEADAILDAGVTQDDLPAGERGEQALTTAPEPGPEPAPAPSPAPEPAPAAPPASAPSSAPEAAPAPPPAVEKKRVAAHAGNLPLSDVLDAPASAPSPSPTPRRLPSPPSPAAVPSGDVKVPLSLETLLDEAPGAEPRAAPYDALPLKPAPISGASAPDRTRPLSQEILSPAKQPAFPAPYRPRPNPCHTPTHILTHVLTLHRPRQRPSPCPC